MQDHDVDASMSRRAGISLTGLQRFHMIVMTLLRDDIQTSTMRLICQFEILSGFQGFVHVKRVSWIVYMICT
jgi:hypothetical protein